MSRQRRSSVPGYVPVPPRALTDGERRTLLEIADALIPDGSAGTCPSGFSDYPEWLDRALAARRDAFDEIVGLVGALADVPAERLYLELKRVSETPESGFEQLSSVVAGAYLLIPEVRRTIGYPGQAQRPPQFDEAAGQIMNGILDPVVARGPVYRSPGGAASAAQGGG